MLNSIWKSQSAYEYNPAVHMNNIYFRIIITATQILAFVILLMINLQMIILNKYSLILLNIQTHLSYLSALLFISLLVFLFVRWLASPKKNFVIILYTLSFALVSCNLVISVVYLEFYFTGINATLPDIKPYPIAKYVTNSPASPLTASLSVVIDALSAASFLLMWVATAILLSQYRLRMGRIRYFLLMSIPLIYYIFPFQGYFGDVLFPLLISSPIAVGMVYALFFSATKQVGALLFSLSFWTASSIVHDNRVRHSLLMSTIGMIIIFGSLENSALQYHVYPPYGLITVAFLPLGAYLLYTGIFTSAKHISGDARLRKEFYKSASTQLALLRSIGVSEMEREFESRIKFVKERFEPLEETYGPQFKTELDEADVKETLHKVLNELYYSKGKKERLDS